MVGDQNLRMIGIVKDIFKKSIGMVISLILWPFRFMISLATKLIATVIAIFIIILLTWAGIYYIGDITSFESLVTIIIEKFADQLL